MIETTEIFIFLRQFGIAVAGAAAFWGVVFLLFGRRSKEKRISALWQGIAQKLLRLFYPSFFVYIIAWIVLAIRHCVFCGDAHEGIAAAEKADQLGPAMLQQYPLFLTLVAIWAVSLGLLFLKKHFLLQNLFFVYGASFVLISLILLAPWTVLGHEGVRQYLSSVLHSWHSMFTLGSVFVVDFLFLALRFNLRPFLKKIFPLITLGIWIGLGLDFLNAGLIFDAEFSPISRILFMQTLIGIVIINGVLLSGPLARAILAFQDRMRSERLPSHLEKIVGLSGSISISAWVSVTALDGFRSLSLAYWQFGLFYVLFVGLVFVSRGAVERLLARYAGN